MLEMLTVVVPAYNEQDSICPVIERLRAARETLVGQGLAREVEILIVDDGSTDRTRELVRGYSDVRLIEHAVNGGYGAALKTGFERGRGELIAFLDADLSYRPESLPELVRALRDQQADLVIGSRMMGLESGMPTTRRVGNWIFAKLLSWLSGRRVTDSASGLRVFRRSALPSLYPLPDGLNLTPAMSARALHEGLRTIEVGIPYDVRGGRSKLHLVRDGLRFFSVIVAITRLYNPLKFFGLLGGAFLLAALLLGLGPAAHYLQFREVRDDAIYRLFTIMVLLVTGINVVTFGAFCNQVLTTLFPHRPLQHSLWGRVLLRRRVIRSAGWVGAICILSAVLLNHQTIWEYATTRHIHMHWVYILTGATLFLTGVQLVMGHFLLTVLEELRSPRDAA